MHVLAEVQGGVRVTGNPAWASEHERFVAFLALVVRRDELGEAEWVRQMRALSPSGDWYAGYVAALTPRVGGAQPQLV